jgi:aminomethyltransferase
VLEEYGAAEAGLEDLAGTHAVIGVDGYRSWDVMRALFGAEVLGLPYLSIERCPFEDIEVALLRAGKTGEFGYLVLVPQDKAESLLGALSAEVERVGGGLCGVEVHDTLRLDGRFFNIYAEGRSVGDPLPLGLQWMIDFDKGAYRGSERIAERRSRGVAEKIVGVRADTGAGTLAAGTKLYAGGAEAGDIRVACRSYVLDADMGLGLLPTGMAYAGVTLNLGSPAGPEVRTVSMPPFMPKSLTVKLDEI